jgi:hypothetical protein
MATLKDLKDLVQETIDKGATTVEEVHQAVASKPLEVLEQLVPEKTPAKDIEAFQQRTIGSVYDMIRTVNQAVGEIAEGILSKIEPAKPEDKPE